MVKATIAMTYKLARRIVIAMVGITVLLIGVALIVLPGPAFVVIPTGLAILSLEFAWARHWLTKMKVAVNHVFNNYKGCQDDSSKVPVGSTDEPKFDRQS